MAKLWKQEGQNVLLTSGKMTINDIISGPQDFNVQGSGYVSGNIGAGVTVPQFKLDVLGSDLLRVKSTDITTAKSMASLVHSQGIGNVADGDFSYFSFLSDSDTTSEAILTQLGVKSTDVTHATRSSAMSVLTMTNGVIGEELAVSSSGIDFKGNVGINFGSPVNPSDGATKGYTDANFQPVDSGLTALSNKSTTGILVQTGADTYTSRSIEVVAGQLTISDADGVSGNPTLDMAPLADSGSGSFLKLSRDSFGRVSGTTPVVSGDIISLVDSTYVNVSGDTMTGALLVNNDIGAGTTTPNTRLEVVEDITFVNLDTFGQFVIKSATGALGHMLNFGVDDTNNLAFIQATDRGNTSMPLILQRYANSVGVGTDTPGPYTLNVNMLDGNGTLFDFGTTSSALTFSSPTTNAISILAGASDYLALGAGGLEGLRVSPSNNFGFGETNPTFRLESTQAVDGEHIGLLIHNSQANSAASINEAAYLLFGFGGDKDVGRIGVTKENDYTDAANSDSSLDFWNDVNGAITRQMRLRSNSDLQLSYTAGSSGLNFEPRAVTSTLRFDSDKFRLFAGKTGGYTEEVAVWDDNGYCALTSLGANPITNPIYPFHVRTDAAAHNTHSFVFEIEGTKASNTAHMIVVQKNADHSFGSCIEVRCDNDTADATPDRPRIDWVGPTGNSWSWGGKSNTTSDNFCLFKDGGAGQGAEGTIVMEVDYSTETVHIPTNGSTSAPALQVGTGGSVAGLAADFSGGTRQPYIISNGQVSAYFGNSNSASYLIAHPGRTVSIRNNSGFSIVFADPTNLSIGSLGGTSSFNCYRNSVTGRSISATGTINASGADYAEYEEKSELCGEILKGDIIGFDSNGLLTDVFNDAVSFGVKSTDPAIVGGDLGTKYDAVNATDEEKEEIRIKHDRVAYSGKVPVNISGGTVGDYLIPKEDTDGKITGYYVSSPSFEEYLKCVGQLRSISDEGTHIICVKVS